jgi:Glycosyltransferase family 87
MLTHLHSRAIRIRATLASGFTAVCRALLAVSSSLRRSPPKDSNQKSWRRVPFSSLNRDAWRRLALVAIVALYLVTVFWNFLVGSTFSYLAVDFRSYVASARIVRDHGYGAVYDLSLQTTYQRALISPKDDRALSQIETIPTPYLPPYVVAFVPLLAFDPVTGWLVWTAINLVVFLWYVRRLLRIAGNVVDKWLLFNLAVSLPVFFNLFFGQVNVWLLICLGEALIAARRQRPLASGLWLAAMLLKPQTLLLIIPGLLLRKEFKSLLGFGVGAFGVGVLSFLMVGWDGMYALFRLITGYASPDGLPSNGLGQMMNWRGLAVNLEGLISSPLWPFVAVGCSIVTAVIAIGLWRVPADPTSAKYSRIWLGTYAATCLVAWHSHVHMALPLLAPAIFVWGDSAWKSRPLSVWLFVPVAVYLIYFYAYTPIAFLFGLDVGSSPDLLKALPGLSLFLVNLLMFGVAYNSIVSPNLKLVAKPA